MRELTRVRAKAVIVEIIRQNGGVLRNKTNLFKAFWKSHVAAAARGLHLTSYPIVRMPRGPGIHNVSHLLAELMLEDAIEVEEPRGMYDSFEFRVLRDDAYADTLSDDDRKAIAEGVAYVSNLSAGATSENSHRDSRSWNASNDGDELDITLDAMEEIELQRLRKRFADTLALLE